MKKRLLLLLVALLCTAGSLWLTQSYVQANLREQEVLVFSQEIKAYTRITSDMIKTQKVGMTGLHPQVATAQEQVLGRYLTSQAVPGEIILRNKLSQENGLSQGYLYELKPDERVIAVATDLTRSVGGTVQSGDVVDLIAVMDEKSGGEPRAKTFLQQIKVIDVRDPGAHSLDQTKQSHKEKESEIINSTSQKQIPGAVVLVVKPYQAEQIALYQKMGEITLTVNPKQTRFIPSGGVRLSQL